MSITTVKTRGTEHLYFETDNGLAIYLGLADSVLPSQFRTENVKESLEYLLQEFRTSAATYSKLLSMLPPSQREIYLSKLEDVKSKRMKTHKTQTDTPYRHPGESQD